MVKIDHLASEERTPSRTLSRADGRLRPLLERDYVGFVETASPSGPSLMPPTATATMIFNVGEPFGGFPAAFIAGMEQTAFLLERHAGTSCIDVKLTPLGAFTLLGGPPLHELTGRAVDIREVHGQAATALVEALRETASWPRRFALIDGFLLRCAATGPQPSRAIVWVWQQLVQTRGGTPIAELADEIGWSRRHLIAMCREQLGLPPKTLAKILRFKKLLEDCNARRDRSWPDLAAEHGYYDQSHLIRDFREFTGMTPTDFLARDVDGAAAWTRLTGR